MKKIIDIIESGINGCSTTYRAVIPDMLMEHMVPVRGQMRRKMCRVLRIYVTRSRYEHREGMFWNIFEDDILEVVNQMIRKDDLLVDRLDAGALSRVDIETIIRRASFQLVKLNLRS